MKLFDLNDLELSETICIILQHSHPKLQLTAVSGLQSVVHSVSEVRLRPPAVLLQPARAVLMNSEIHDKCGHMVEPAGQARGAS